MTGDEPLWGLQHPTADQVAPAPPGRVRAGLWTVVQYVVLAALVIGAVAVLGLLLLATFVDIGES